MFALPNPTMNLPDILNVAIGLIVLYLLLSSIGSLLLDLLTGTAHYREEILFVTINRLLAGEPDEPWNIAVLVMDRIGRRLPEKSRLGLGLLRQRLVSDYMIKAPGTEVVASAAKPPKKQKTWGDLWKSLVAFCKKEFAEKTNQSASAANSQSSDHGQPPDSTGSKTPANSNDDSNTELPRDIVQKFWEHPKIRSLVGNGVDAPPSMESSTFATVVIDIAVPRDAQGVLPDNRLALVRALQAPNENVPVSLRETLRVHGLSSEIPVGATGEALWAPFRENVAAWFDEAAGRASEYYRSTMKRLLFLLGLVLATILNADTLRILHLLSHDRPLREAVAAYSETLVAENNASTAPARSTISQLPPPANLAPPQSASTPGQAKPATPADSSHSPTPASTPVAQPRLGTTAVSELQKTRQALGDDIERLRKLEQMGFPIGWSGPDEGFSDTVIMSQWADQHPSYYAWFIFTAALFVVVFFKFIGLGATALAVSQGAPFWYELTNKLINLRKGVTDTATAAEPVAGKPNAAAPVTGPVVPASAMPLEIGHDLAAPATSFSARKAYWLARAAAAAYSPLAEVEALARETWKFHDFYSFDQKKTGTQGFCAVDDNIMLIAFRGTELKELNDILVDARVNLMLLPWKGSVPLPDRQIHTGFHDGLESVWQNINIQIEKWTTGRSVRQILITGHSLGGALATLMFTRLALDPKLPVPTLYTFGCPKVGDGAFAKELDRAFPERIFRLINNLDIVPTLPPSSDYHQAGHAFTFDAKGEIQSQISGLDRVLGFARQAMVKNIQSAVRETVDDHSMAYYVKWCEALAKKA